MTFNAGLALVGQFIKRMGISRRVDRQFPVRVGGIANSDVLKSYLALLVQGKNDFDAIEPFSSDGFFKRLLGIGAVPSSPTMRQRMNTHAASWFGLVDELNELLLSPKGAGCTVDFGALPCGYMPMDWNTFVMNNDGSKKKTWAAPTKALTATPPASPTLAIWVTAWSWPCAQVCSTLLWRPS